RNKPPRLFHVIPVRIAVTLQQLLLFLSSANDEQNERQTARNGNKPICGRQADGDESSPRSHIKRMANPSIRACRDQGMLFPRYHSIRDVLAEMPERPGRQRTGDRHHPYSYPSQPDRKQYRRPGHPCWINHVNQEADPTCQAKKAQRNEDEDTFLSPVQFLARRLGFHSMVQPDGNDEEKSCDQDESEYLIVVHGLPSSRQRSIGHRPNAGGVSVRPNSPKPIGGRAG